MKRLLIVSPHFPPANSPDSQRIRMSLPYYEKYGWEADVLCIDSIYDSVIIDDQLNETVPININVFKTKVVSKSISKYLGIKGVYWRCLPYLYQQGCKLIRENKYDLIFISTTIFPTMIFGKKWNKKFKIPYVLDIQDPWLNDYKYIDPPGGRIKYYLSQSFAKLFEPGVLKSANHIITVSPKYPKIFVDRYPKIPIENFTVIPFGASENDFEIVDKLNIKQNNFDKNDGYKHWVYIGRGGEDIYYPLKSFFIAVKEDRVERPEYWHKIKLHFIGTSYSNSKNAKKTIEPIAKEVGIEDIVEEETTRVSHLESLKLLLDSDAALIFGSEDLSYSPSKIYSYILSQKPLICLFHEKSHVVGLLNEIGISNLPIYSDKLNNIGFISSIKNKFREVINGYNSSDNINWSNFEKYKAGESARSQCKVFDDCII